LACILNNVGYNILQALLSIRYFCRYCESRIFHPYSLVPVDPLLRRLFKSGIMAPCFPEKNITLLTLPLFPFPQISSSPQECMANDGRTILPVNEDRLIRKAISIRPSRALITSLRVASQLRLILTKAIRYCFYEKRLRIQEFLPGSSQ